MNIKKYFQILPGLLFFLDPNINYRIIFHDPKFYHMVSNTFTFPRIWLEYKVGLNMKSDYYDWYYISVTEHHLLNRPEQPCEEEEDYDFLECVKTSQARMVGCRPPWDIWMESSHHPSLSDHGPAGSVREAGYELL